MPAGPWITPPLDWFIYGADFVETGEGGTSVATLSYWAPNDPGTRVIPFEPAAGEPERPVTSPRIIDIEWRVEHGTEPPGGPYFGVFMSADSRNIGSQTGTIDSHHPGGFNTLKAASDSGGDIIPMLGNTLSFVNLISVVVPPGPFDWTLIYTSGVTTSAYEMMMPRDPFIPLLGDSGLILDARWRYQPADYRWIYAGGLPLYQRQRTDGLGGGPAHQGVGLSSRQLSVFQRGQL